jgi:hypothetical protein
MPALSIIPAAAVMDETLTPTQLRVLCAIGIHTDKLGGNVWASVRTLAKEANVAERTVQAACAVLVERGYLKVIPRVGQTNLYEVQLEVHRGVNTDALLHRDAGEGVQELVRGRGAAADAPKRPQRTTPKSNESSEAERAVLQALWTTYPKRPEPHSFPAALKALVPVLRAGVDGARIVRSVQRYAAHCLLNKTEPQYVKSMPRFFADDFWKAYDVVLVHGRTREEWARSGQDVAKFDALVGNLNTPTQRSA